ncbi:DNA polymerase II [Catenovulum agarivorans DS-2]|uniref:DNA polymerase n=1 Tax=Catenovulum agarivorans DS-2 TaxID=1328313 RepID=W7QJD3_9ALTE|nr:DNA polymerase II [Catenovulum agarivorans]EWH08258.1 DNA polymerase II [Catenovulum agarivorans DS-2]
MLNKQPTNNLTPAYILSKSSYDRHEQAIVEVWLKTKTSTVCVHYTEQKNLFFIEQKSFQQAYELLSAQKIAFEYNSIKHKTFQQNQVVLLQFANIRSGQKANRILSKHQIECFEDDIRLHDRYLMPRRLKGAVNIAATGLQHKQVYKDIPITPSNDISIKLSSCSLDVECSEYGELYSVALHMPPVELIIMIGPTPNEATALDIIWVDNEAELLTQLIKQLNLLDPDIIIGWNVINFDFRLLLKRAERHRIKLCVGRNGSEIRWRNHPTEQNQGYVNIDGRVVIDGIDALKTATYQFESFSLENVAQKLLGKGKLTHDVDNRMAQINYDFEHNKLALAKYNLQDTKLVTEIFEQTKLIDFLMLRSQLTGLDLDRVGGSVAAFTNVYLPKLHKAGYIAPNLPEGGGLASPGGYVMDSKPGLYSNVLVLDFKSLYPSIIRTFKIDPLGLIEGLQNPQQAIEGFKGALFSRDKHFLPDIITQLWAQRDQAKEQQDQARSQAIKILMNSFYGVLGSGGCRFYDTRLASSITMRGHQIMQQTAQWIEAQGYDVIYGDTDSTFVWLENVTDSHQAREIGLQLQDLINQKWQKWLKDTYQLESHLEIEFETLFSRFLMPTIRGSEAGSKKRYAGVLAPSNQQHTEPQLIFKGLETVRSDWTELAREFQQQLYLLVFTEKDPSDYIINFIQQVLSGERDQHLVYRKRLRRNLADYQKNIPPQVKAARMADEENSKRGKSLRYQNKGWIRYLITTTGPQPVEYQQSPIDYQHYLDKQIKPIADGILPFIGMSFDKISSRQLNLF